MNTDACWLTRHPTPPGEREREKKQRGGAIEGKEGEVFSEKLLNIMRGSRGKIGD